MKKIIAISLLCFSFSAQASWKEKVRPYIKKYFSNELAIKLLGEADSDISLPKIPKVNTKAHSASAIGNDDGKTIPKKEKKKYDYAFVIELYQAVKNEKPTQVEISKWLNVLDQGGSRDGVYRGVVLDSHYAGLENLKYPLNEETKDFALKFLETYLNRKLNRETLKSTNFYTLKRIAAEKALETMSAFKDKKDLYMWYAIFSSEIVRKYPAAWNGKIRSSDSKRRHFDWAKQVPLQHVKSEFIIKLHKTFNYLSS